MAVGLIRVRPAWIERALESDKPNCTCFNPAKWGHNGFCPVIQSAQANWPRCAWCLKHFPPGTPQNPRKYCSDRCRAKMANSLRPKRIR